jgi:hypothetical protein
VQDSSSNTKPSASAPSDPPRSSYSERLKSIFRTVAHTVDVLARDAPSWARPFARVTLFLAMAIFTLATLPLAPLYRRQHRRLIRDWDAETRPVNELRLRVRRIWVEDSPQKAAAHVRSVFDLVRASPDGVEIAPYGRFAGVMGTHDLASAAYEYELSVGRTAEALEIAEYMCGRHPTDIGLGPTWIVSKAKCLVRLGRVADAKALLLAHRNVYDKNAEVNRYLEELRSTSSSPERG